MTGKYPISWLFPQAQDRTAYAKSNGYLGKKPVYVLDGKVISHGSVDWFEFCAGIRTKRHKLPDTFSVLVWHKTATDGVHHSILGSSSSWSGAVAAFWEYLRRPSICMSFGPHQRVTLNGPNGLVCNLQD